MVATAVLFDIGDGKGYARSSEYAANLGLSQDNIAVETNTFI